METSSDRTPFTIGVCSDTHYWFGGPNHEGESLQLQSHSVLLLETLLSELENADLDLVLHLGDMVSGGGTFQMPADDFHASLQRATEGFKALSTDSHALPGNHDCLAGDGWSEFSRQWSLERGLGKTIDTEYARLVLINAQGHSREQVEEALPADPIYGWVSEQELARIEDALATADNRPVIFFLHQLLQPWATKRGWIPFYGVRNGRSVLELINFYGNVPAVFQGHAHRLDVQTITLDVEMNTRSSGLASADSGECSFVVLPSLIEYPLGWLKLTVSDDSICVALQRLPLAALAEQSNASGEGQSWRAGQSGWQNFEIAL